MKSAWHEIFEYFCLMKLFTQFYQFILGFLLIGIFQTAHANVSEQEAQLLLREVGHSFLLEIGDSTSRVLPIKQEGDRFAVQFDRDFAFDPDQLTTVVYQTFRENKLAGAFLVEVENCESHEVVHSFEANLNKDESSIACKGRRLPEDCYVFYFSMHALTSTNFLPAEKAHSNTYYLYVLLPLILLLSLLILWWVRKSSFNSSVVTIGQFQFDQKRMLLNLKAQSIELSAKESDLLSLLYANESETLERGYILNHVWGDEGDYIGRTLDVFISKLRKKLAADPSLKIINVRGVGYRFVVNK